jgi:putative oxidoreductase
MKFLQLNFIPRSTDLGLLVLRLWLGLTMAIQHGWVKWLNFDVYAPKFLPLFGLPSNVSLGLAIFAELICSGFLILGLFTRFAALNLAVTMSVAFFIAHQMRLVDDPSDPMKKGGELAFIYLAAYVSLFFTGAGKFSVDSKLGGR